LQEHRSRFGANSTPMNAPIAHNRPHRPLPRCVQVRPTLDEVLPARRDLEHVSPYLVGEFDDVVHLAESQT